MTPPRVKSRKGGFSVMRNCKGRAKKASSGSNITPRIAVETPAEEIASVK